MPERLALRRQSSLTASAPPRPKAVSPRNMLTASAKVNPIGESANSASRTGVMNRAWQAQAWMYYDEIGEMHYSMNFVGACLSRCALTIGIEDSKGHVGPAFDDEGKPITEVDGNPIPGTQFADEALALVQALKSDIGGQPQLLRSIGINLGVAGEFHLVGTQKYQASDDQNVEQVPLNELYWEVLSTEEFRLDPGGKNYERRRAPGGVPEIIPASDVHAIRIWRQHPRFSDLPDSSIRSVLDVLEELVLLTREVRGEALSRLTTAMMLLVPEEIEWPADEGADEGEDSFTYDLVETMSTAITDKGSAAAVVPFVVRAPADLLHPDKFRTIDLSPQKTSDSASKRTEAVQRFAQGVDLPVEIVTGHANTTFSNAVQIDDSTFKAHIEPVLEVLCDALTVGYLRPGLGNVETRYVVTFDSTELVARPNRAGDAKDLHDRWAISDATLRTSAGFSDSDKPDEEELAERVARKQALNIRQTVQETPADVHAEAQAGSSDGGPINQGPLNGNNLDKTLQASAFHIAAEAVVDRAIAKVGARLRSQAKKIPTVRDNLSQVPDAEIPVTLGPALVRQLSTQDDFFSKEFDSLWSVVTRETGDQNYADRLRSACISIAEDRLYQPRQRFPHHKIPELMMPSVDA